jgi:protein phosphatase 2C family protein 2/3
VSLEVCRLTLDPPLSAEFRGPGVHHNFDDSDSGYDVEGDNQRKSFGMGGYKGRIIFLGDGTEVLTDSDDTEMFDNTEEDKDLASQVSKAGDKSIDGTSTGDESKGGEHPTKKLGKDEKIDTGSSSEEVTTGTELKAEPAHVSDK